MTSAARNSLDPKYWGFSLGAWMVSLHRSDGNRLVSAVMVVESPYIICHPPFCLPVVHLGLLLHPDLHSENQYCQTTIGILKKLYLPSHLFMNSLAFEASAEYIDASGFEVRIDRIWCTHYIAHEDPICVAFQATLNTRLTRKQ